MLDSSFTVIHREIADETVVERKSHLPTRAVASRIAIGAGAAGLLGDLLFQGGPGGVGITLYLVAVAATLTASARRLESDSPPGPMSISTTASDRLVESRALSLETRILLWISVLFAALVAIRDSEILAVANVLAALTAISLAALTTRPCDKSGMINTKAEELLARALALVKDVLIGPFEFLFVNSRMRKQSTLEEGQSKLPVGAIVRSLVVAFVLLVVLTLLLASGDPVFRNLVAWPSWLTAVDLPRHLLTIAFLAWPVVGLTWSGVKAINPNSDGLTRFISLNRLDVLFALVAMTGLFAIYMLTQVRVLFGGAEYVLATTGLTLAQYARNGFFALTLAAAIVVFALLALDSLLRNDGLAEWRASRRLSFALLTLLSLMMISAVARMSIYVGVFGISVDRIVALSILAWVACVIVWFSLTALRGNSKRFMVGAFISAALTLLVVNVINPESMSIRSAVARGDQFDVKYAVRETGSDAVPSLINSIENELISSSSNVGSYAPTCVLAQHLIDTWGPQAERRQTRSTLSYLTARRMVSRNLELLRSMDCATLDSEVASDTSRIPSLSR